MKQYLDLVRHILDTGVVKTDRTGTGTKAVFGTQTKYDLREGFPLLTTKKVLFDAVVWELLWFLRGSTNINDDLTQHTPIWDAWADDKGELGPIYGYQWRNWPRYDFDPETGQCKKSSIDQIRMVCESLKTNPDSRRHIVSAWNVSDIEAMVLPPCHLLFQFFTAEGRLDCQLYQRSADVALGVPFNIAGYALLMVMIAQECSLIPGIFTHTLGDAHIYLNHISGLEQQLTREPKQLPEVNVNHKPLDELKFEDFSLRNYVYDPFIKFKISV